MYLIPIPAFTDNYLWLLHDRKRAVVVDPGDAGPVLAALSQASLQLAAILVTHHHSDHVGGINALCLATGAHVYGPAHETIPHLHTALKQGDAVDVLGLRFDVLDVPGHTAGHIAFYCATCQLDGDESAKPLLFCGDTLFSGGCGRLFEGTAAQMLASLDRLGALPGPTRVCCAHEYTLSNLRFALTVEPNNPELIAYYAHCLAVREKNLPTLPSTIAQELLINPFLRCRIPSVTAAVSQLDLQADDALSVFAALRQRKNQF